MKPFWLAKRFVAGTTLEEALSVTQHLHAKGLQVTLDHLGEDVTDRRKANNAAKTYIAVLNTLKKQGVKANIAVKLSQIGLAINQKLALKNLKAILLTAKKDNLVVEIDMEGSKYTDGTIACYTNVIHKHPRTVLALQAYLYRSPDDLKKIARFKGNVRIIKGAYKESDNIAFAKKEEVNKQYVTLTQYALNHCPFTFIGTHDEVIIRHLKNFVKYHKIPQKKYEFQMLYGIRQGLQEQLVSQGHNVRVYLPYGEAWFPYFSRRIRERKENFLFVLKNMFRK